MLRAVARRAIHHCNNEKVALASSSRPQSHHAHARSSSQLLHTLSLGGQPALEGAAAIKHQWNFTRQIHDRARHVSIAEPLVNLRLSSMELPPLLHYRGGRRCFSLPAPQKETQHLSSVAVDGLQSDRDKDSSLGSAPGELSDKTTKHPPPKLDEENKPKLVEKKDSPLVKKATDLTTWAIKSLVALLAKTPGVLWFYMTHPAEFRKKLGELKEMAVKEAHHYWMGSKVCSFVL